jgi:hypothetical protein
MRRSSPYRKGRARELAARDTQGTSVKRLVHHTGASRSSKHLVRHSMRTAGVEPAPLAGQDPKAKAALCLEPKALVWRGQGRW